MDASEILNVVLGSGLVATMVAIVTLRATVRKANADAEKAVADAESVRMDNVEHATRVLVENIVKPLKEELNETRKYLESAKREMARLRKAIDTANSCKHHDDCPVLNGMREQPKERVAERRDHVVVGGPKGQRVGRGADAVCGGGSGGDGGADAEGGQPA